MGPWADKQHQKGCDRDAKVNVGQNVSDGGGLEEEEGCGWGDSVEGDLDRWKGNVELVEGKSCGALSALHIGEVLHLSSHCTPGVGPADSSQINFGALELEVFADVEPVEVGLVGHQLKGEYSFVFHPILDSTLQTSV